ncbi:hypothetical protein C8E89_103415 [Mycolicibacterium moriokaense]|uniref:Uncharacterized protein n=1 Tax=Mycolicibacterium moriokaense TaxID=39691 RepID=A0A318HU19_9MYCO|nr:hypothetical protein C8E89_103415 [Mycolicibacterium moriokaense]
MPDEPGIQGLHSSKVRHLDDWFGQFRSPRAVLPAKLNGSVRERLLEETD